MSCILHSDVMSGCIVLLLIEVTVSAAIGLCLYYDACLPEVLNAGGKW